MKKLGVVNYIKNIMIKIYQNIIMELLTLVDILVHGVLMEN
jgi:hypothetical protein